MTPSNVDLEAPAGLPDGYCRIPNFLSPDELERWRQLLAGEALYRAVAPRGGGGAGFDWIHGERIRAELPQLGALVEERIRPAVSAALGRPVELIADRRRALRVQRYRCRSQGFRWHLDRNLASALLTLRNTNDGATELIPRGLSRALAPLFFALYPLRGGFSAAPRERLASVEGELLILRGGALLHRGSTRAEHGERLLLLAAFGPAGARPSPIRDSIARLVNYGPGARRARWSKASASTPGT